MKIKRKSTKILTRKNTTVYNQKIKSDSVDVSQLKKEIDGYIAP